MTLSHQGHSQAGREGAQGHWYSARLSGRANARGTITVNNDVPPGSYSALVALSAAGLVERPMYFDYNGDIGGSDVVGYQP